MWVIRHKMDSLHCSAERDSMLNQHATCIARWLRKYLTTFKIVQFSFADGGSHQMRLSRSTEDSIQTIVHTRFGCTHFEVYDILKNRPLSQLVKRFPLCVVARHLSPSLLVIVQEANATTQIPAPKVGVAFADKPRRIDVSNISYGSMTKRNATVDPRCGIVYPSYCNNKLVIHTPWLSSSEGIQQVEQTRTSPNYFMHLCLHNNNAEDTEFKDFYSCLEALQTTFTEDIMSTYTFQPFIRKPQKNDAHTEPYLKVDLKSCNGRWMCDVVQLGKQGLLRHSQTDDIRQYVRGGVQVKLVIECYCLWFMQERCSARWTVQKMEYKQMV